MTGCLPSIRRRAALGFTAALTAALFAGASPDIAAGAERTLRIRALTDTPLPFVSTLVAPSARAAAVCEPAGAVAISHQTPTLPTAPPFTNHVSIYRLDAAGLPVADEPQILSLPKPASLADRNTEVLGLACHPRFPLLYVWQDVSPLPKVEPTDPALSAEFDHLLVYSLEEAQPKLVLATARGVEYHCGAIVGGFALDAAARRLYVPNLQRTGPMQNWVSAIGWIHIDPDGLPAPELGVADPMNPVMKSTNMFGTNVAASATGNAAGSSAVAAATPAPPALDPAAANAARAAKVATWAAQPTRPRLNWEYANHITSDWPVPYNYALIDDNAALMSLYAGITSWVMTDRQGRFCYHFIHPQIVYRFRVTAHPTLPCAYVSLISYDGQIQRYETAEGYLTLVPQTLHAENFVAYTAPLIIAGGKKLALGGASRVFVLDLDERGGFTKQGAQMAVNNAAATAVAWSEKFGRLYVGVEKSP